MTKKMYRLKNTTKFPINILTLILILSFGIRIYNLNYNSPFLDEAIYLELGRQIFSGEWQQEDPFSWVGGNPLFYPTFSAIFGTFGILGSRFLSVLLGTLSVLLMYGFAKNLKLAEKEKTNEIIGLISASILSVLSIPIFLSRWAIYDMLSFTLFLLGLFFLQSRFNLKKLMLWQGDIRFFLAAVFFFLSFLVKYITLILFPIIIMYAIIRSRQADKNAFSASLSTFLLPLLLATGWYIFQNFDHLIHFQQEQVNNVSYGFKQILTRYLTYSFPVLLLASFGTFLLLFQKKLLALVFLSIGAVTIPFVHILTNNYASIHQHAFLSIIFLLPLASYLFAWVIEKRLIPGVAATISVLVIIFVYSLNQVRTLENSWPNTYDVMSFLNRNTTNHERLLSSEGDVAAVSLPNLKNKNINSYYNLNYKQLSEAKAYSAAIKDGYFDYVLFNEDHDNEISNSIKNSFSNHYTSVYNKHPFLVYKRE